MFSLTTTQERLISDFKEHVEKYHTAEDLNQAAARIVRTVTER